MLENWLLNKIKQKDKSFWTKFVAIFASLLFGVMVLIKYYYTKNQVESLKTKDLLNKDDKKDLILQQQLKEIKDKKSDLIKEVIKTDSNINVIDGSITKIKKEAISDLEFVESLEDWDDIEKKVK